MSPLRTKPSAAVGPALSKTLSLSNGTAVSVSNRSNGPTLLATRYSLPAPSSAPALTCPPSSSLRSQASGFSAGFTIVEVMMASVILVVGFIGMIQGITIGSEMMATARRQTLAAQIIAHESEKLRLSSWAGLPAAGTISSITIDSQFTNAIAACGLTTSTLTLARTTTNIDTDGDSVTDLKEITFTVTWNKSGTTTAAATPTGSWLDRMAFARSSPIARTYTRTSTAYYGKYGLSLAYQRS